MTALDDKLAEIRRAVESSPQAAVAKKVGVVSLFLAQVTASAMWLWWRLRPVIDVLLWLPKNIVWFYINHVWNRWTRKNGEFNLIRGGFVLSGTGIFLYFLALPILNLILDTVLYLTTAQVREIVYLTNSQEISPITNEHSAQGCYELPCSDDNSVYFRIRVSAFNELWSISHGYGLFFPDYVAAAIPSAVSKCKVTSYGVRIKLFMRSTEVYPDLLESICTPITELNE